MQEGCDQGAHDLHREIKGMGESVGGEEGQSANRYKQMNPLINPLYDYIHHQDHNYQLFSYNNVTNVYLYVFIMF